MPHAMLPTNEDIISDILTGYALSAAGPWADVPKSSSVKVNVERTGATFGSVAWPDRKEHTLARRL
jgi:hypothetical protein